MDVLFYPRETIDFNFKIKVRHINKYMKGVTEGKKKQFYEAKGTDSLPQFLPVIYKKVLTYHYAYNKIIQNDKKGEIK